MMPQSSVLFGLKFANNIHYKIKTSQASKARLSGGSFWSYQKFMGRFGCFPTTALKDYSIPDRGQHVATMKPRQARKNVMVVWAALPSGCMAASLP